MRHATSVFDLLRRIPQTLEQERARLDDERRQWLGRVFAALGNMGPRQMLEFMLKRIQSRGDMTPEDLRAFAQQCDRHADELERRPGR